MVTRLFNFIKMGKKSIILFLLLQITFMAHTYSVNINAINIHNKSGSLVTILLEEQPKITFEGNDVVLATQMNVVNYPSAEIVKLTYLDVKDATGIDNFNSFGVVFSFNNDVVKIQNLVSQTKVSLYTVEGVLVASGMTDAKGGISLPMPKGTQTCMIVKTPSLTFKIRKP